MMSKTMMRRTITIRPGIFGQIQLIRAEGLRRGPDRNFAEVANLLMFAGLKSLEGMDTANLLSTLDRYALALKGGD